MLIVSKIDFFKFAIIKFIQSLPTLKINATIAKNAGYFEDNYEPSNLVIHNSFTLHNFLNSVKENGVFVVCYSRRSKRNEKENERYRLKRP